MKRLLVTYFAATTIASAQFQPVSGTISGVLTGEDGSALASASIALHRVATPQSRFGDGQADWTAISQADGTFQFTGLPAGDYTLCPTVPNSTWLNPCDWNFPTPTATITRSAPSGSVNITLTRGVAIPVRINDPGGLLAQNEGKTPGAGLLLEVSDGRPGSFFRAVPLVSKDSGGRNHQIVIPFNTQLTLFVHPTFYRVTNAASAPLSQGATTKIPLLTTVGQQVAPIVFSITGHQ